MVRHIGRPARRAGVLAWPAALLPVTALALSINAPTPRIMPPPPDVPRQPGAAAAPCTPPPSKPDSWTLIASRTGESFTTAPNIAGVATEQIVVDPWQPCRMYRADTGDVLTRSTDSGRSWQPVLKDDATGYQTLATSATPFHMRGVNVVSPGRVMVAENGNGDAVVSSSDAGAHWALSNQGIAGEPVQRVLSADSTGHVLYAVTTPPPPDGPVAGGLPGLYLSQDAGASWTATNLPRLPGTTSDLLIGPLSGTCGRDPSSPCNPSLQVQVDPASAGHIYVSVPVSRNGNTAAQTLLFESNDDGQTWLPTGSLPGEYTQLLVTRSAAHGLRLYVTAYNPSIYGQATPMRSDNGGKNWTPIPVDSHLGFASLAADPANPDLMAYVGGVGGYLSPDLTSTQMWAYVSYDGFDTTSVATPLRGLKEIQPLVPALTGGYSSEQDVELQADRFGSFYVGVRDFCYWGTQKAPCFPDGAPNVSHWYERQAYYRLTPPPPPPPVSLFTTNGKGAGGTPSPRASGEPMQQLRQCPAPSTTPNRTQINYGALTFDGTDLLYTQYGETAMQPYQGIVHQMDPVTCRDAGVLTVTFDPADLQKVADKTKEPETAVHPYVDTLAYDPNHDVLWLSLASGSLPLVGNPAQGGVFANGPNIVGVFSATFPPGPSGPRTAAVATLRFFKPHCSGSFGEGLDMFAYDFSSNTIWGCDWGKGYGASHPPVLPIDPLGGGNDYSGGQPAHLRPDGSSIPSCVNSSTGFGSVATWVVGAPGKLYVQSEDDETLFEIDSESCAVLRTMKHRNFGEPFGEDEQMACDSVTFGREMVAAGTTPLTKPTSVIWLRDANAAEIVAYVLPDSFCPYPTTTALLAPAQVTRGEVATLCAHLSRRGIPVPLKQEVLDFHLNGSYVGRGYTDNYGGACVRTFVNLAPGSYPVTVSFPGTPEYYPSGDSGRLIVNVPVATGSGPPPLPPPLIPQNPTLTPPQQVNPAPAPNPGVASEPQIQAQSQSQAQGQSQAQANLQPGVVAQEQEQVQVQVAPAALPQEQQQQLGYAMNAADRDNLDKAMGLAGGAAFAAFVAAGVAWAVRAPGSAVARARRRLAQRD